MSIQLSRFVNVRGWLGRRPGICDQGRKVALKMFVRGSGQYGLATMLWMSLLGIGRADGLVGVVLADTANGPLITNIVPGSPAESAGLRIYSTITHVEGQPVSGYEFFSRAINRRLGFGHATLTVNEGKQKQKIRVGIVDRRTALPASVLSDDAKDAIQEIADKNGDAIHDNDRPGKPLVGARFHARSLTDKTLKCISHLPDLEWIEVKDSEELKPGEGWTHLARMKKLRAIYLRGDGRSKDGGAVVNPAILKEISAIPGLRELDLTDGNIGSELAAQLANCTGLRELTLTKTDLTDNELTFIGRLTNLEYLDLNGTQISGVGLQHLANLKRLRYLDLSNNPVTDKDVAFLNPLEDLAKLELSHTQVTDLGLESLTGLRSLKHLGLNHTGTKVDDSSVKISGGANPNHVLLGTTLRELLPQGSDGGPTTKGISLDQLGRFIERYPQLELVEVRGPIFEPFDLRELGRRFPHLQIETTNKTLRPGESE